MKRRRTISTAKIFMAISRWLEEMVLRYLLSRFACARYSTMSTFWSMSCSTFSSIRNPDCYLSQLVDLPRHRNTIAVRAARVKQALLILLLGLLRQAFGQ